MVECVVSDSKRRKKCYGDHDFLNQSPPSSTEDTEDAPMCRSLDDDPTSDVPSALDGMLSASSNGSLDLETHHHVPHMLYQTQGHRLTPDERQHRLTSLSQVMRTPLPTPLQIPQTQNHFPRPVPRPAQTLPAYVRPLPQRILSEDIEYLEKKGALTIPETSLRNELLRSYVQYVHPFMPILDLKDFLKPIERNDGLDPISLLLFQAVMFAGTAYVDMRFLQNQGFESRKPARKVFFQRVRLLYDFDYESDRIPLVQALLLLTYWYETPDDQKDTWYWMGVSLSLAHTIGVHRNPEHSRMDLRRQRLWKRIWWSCFTRDRLIALGMRRPTRIRNEDFDVPMLEPDDFDTEPLSNDLVKLLGGSPSIRDANKRMALASLFIELTKLCICVGHVLASQYSVLSHRLGGTTETTMMLLPKKLAAQREEVMQCDDELSQWYNQLTTDAQYFSPGTKDRASTTDGEVINVHRALLHMIFSTTSSALHRPQVLPSTPNLDVDDDLREMSRHKVREAASDITEVARDLYVQDQVRYLPTSGCTVMLPAIIIHLLDVRSNDENVRNTAMRRFYQCMQVLQRLREMYASADSAISFLEAAIRKANIQIPMPAPFAKTPTAGRLEDRNPVNTENGTMYAHSTNQLTPPPEALHMAKQLLYSSSITPEERNLFYAVSPPQSDRSLNDILTGSAVGASRDALSSMHGDTMTYHEQAYQQEAAQDTYMETEKNDFDALINFDGGADLFAAEDGVGVDLEADWMAGLPGDEESKSGYELVGADKVLKTEKVLTGDLEQDLALHRTMTDPL